MAKKNNVLIAVALAGLMASGAAVAQDKAPAATDAKMGKCYGVAKAGKNDCANKSGSHSCAGQAKMDHDKGDFMKMTAEKCAEAKGTFEAMAKPASK